MITDAGCAMFGQTDLQKPAAGSRGCRQWITFRASKGAMMIEQPTILERGLARVREGF
ncbi:MAG: hypothetical protein L0229_06905 [Blastocatellia bacterium]|nr:hypothetical protein [Blastocatellia bacterium]